ncbi:MAG: hypothetical protein IT444_07480 [Phycisphaeraceae bacterium]|nr:hypothetical protein [Phycisphaeraceae bacterium]
MKPPIPTKPSVESEKPPRRAALMTMAIALTFILLLAAYLGYQQLIEPLPPIPPEPATQPYTRLSDTNPGWRAGPMNPRSILDAIDTAEAQGDNNAILNLQPGDEIIQTEPAGLSPFPEDDLIKAHRISGLRRNASPITEEIVVWDLSGVETSDAMTHYENAAVRAGFTLLSNTNRHGPLFSHDAPVEPTGEDMSNSNRIFVRTQPNSEPSPAGSPRYQLLVVRTSATPEGCRIVLWLRYAMHNPPQR